MTFEEWHKNHWHDRKEITPRTQKEYMNIGWNACEQQQAGIIANLNGWIDVEKTQPPLIPGQDYSENVWGFDGLHILVVSFFIDSDGWYWANAYGDVWGDAEFDDDYDIKYWQPILIPEPPILMSENDEC